MPRLFVFLIVCSLLLSTAAFAQAPDRQALQQKADQGDPMAMFELGEVYRKGRGVPKDFKKAFDLYTRSALKGCADGQAGLGFLYLTGQGVEENPSKAVDLFRNAAKQGSAAGRHGLGFAYHFGKGVTEDYHRAMELYLKAAGQGYAMSMNNIGVLYKDGKGVKENMYTAMEWYEKGAERGETLSYRNLARMYRSGHSMIRDRDKALECYRKAAELGDVNAQKKLAEIYEHGFMGEKENQKEAAKWYKKAAGQGDAEAQINLAYRYNKGNGVLQSKKRSLMWYRKAAEQGNARAQWNLGVGLANPDEGREWLFKSAAQGYGSAYGSLSTMYYGGPKGSSKSQVLSHMWANIQSTSDDAFERERGEQWRDSLLDKMTQEDIDFAQELALDWMESDEQRRTALAEEYHADYGNLAPAPTAKSPEKNETAPASGGTVKE